MLARVPAISAETTDTHGDWLGLGDASRLLGISQGTLRRWADDGRVTVFTTPGGHRRFPRRALRALLPAARAHRPPLAELGASPERITRRYRRGTVAPARDEGWLGRLNEAEVAAFRERGRAIVTSLLAYLDADEAGAREAALAEAEAQSEAHGLRAGEAGASIGEAVTAFLQFRTPFLRSLAELAQRRGLDTREATELLVEAESAMDRLLLRTMAGHLAATTANATNAMTATGDA